MSANTSDGDGAWHRVLLPRAGGVVLGTVFLAAGILKALAPGTFLSSLPAYGVPSFLEIPTLILLPALEIALGLMLLTGWRLRASALGAVALLLVFAAAIGWGWSRGTLEDCSCFGTMLIRSPGEALRQDLLLMAVAVVTALRAPAPRFFLPRRVGDSIAAGLAILVALALAFAVATGIETPVDAISTGPEVEGVAAGADGPGRLSPEPMRRTTLTELGLRRSTDDEWLVFLFHPRCPTCQEVAGRVGSYVGASELPELLGVTFEAEPDEVADYQRRAGAPFPVYEVPREEFGRLTGDAAFPQLAWLRRGEVVRVWRGKLPDPGVVVVARGGRETAARRGNGPQESYAEIHGRITAARGDEDWEEMIRAVRAGLELRPGYPALLQLTALAEARRGRPEAAVDQLGRLAAMGVVLGDGVLRAFDELLPGSAWEPVRQQLVSNRQPVGRARVAFRLADRAFFPEGIAHDPADGSFLLASVLRARVVRVLRDGTVGDFAGPLGPWRTLGLAIDPQRRELWVSFGIVGELDRGLQAPGPTGVARYRLEDGALLERHLLPVGDSPAGPASAAPSHLLGDVLVGPDGTVYTTDSLGGGVWRLIRGAGDLEPLVSPGIMVSPQGLALDEGGEALFVADYRGGIFRIELATGEASRLPVPDDVCAYGIDGLYRFGRDLVGIQNGVPPHRVVRFRLDGEGRRLLGQETLLSGDPRLGEPTLGTVVGSSLYFVANSPWGLVDTPERLREAPEPLVLELSLAEPVATRVPSGPARAGTHDERRPTPNGRR